MTKEGFEKFEEGYRNSNVSLKRYLAGKNVSVPQYYYWKRKYIQRPKELSGQFVNITSKINQNQQSAEVVLEFPNGKRIIFGSYPGSKILLELVQS